MNRLECALWQWQRISERGRPISYRTVLIYCRNRLKSACPVSIPTGGTLSRRTSYKIRLDVYWLQANEAHWEWEVRGH